MKLFEKGKLKQSRTLSFASILIMVLLGFNTFATYSSIQTLKENHNDLQWGLINSVLLENEAKATIQANAIKENIKEDLLSAYGENTSKLKYDMDNLDVNSDLLKILNENIDGKYLNVDTDNDDLFVLSTWQEAEGIDLKGRVITDKSINCSANGIIRSFDKELEMHSNYELGYDALDRILSQSKEKPIFWEFIKSTDINHEQIAYCDIDALKQVFINEGIKGLKTYEILVPVYINDRNDIMENDIVDNLGSLNEDNRQLVVVQGFSLYDALMKDYTTQIQAENNNCNNMISSIELKSIFGNILMLVVFSSIVKVQNLEIEIEELELGDDTKRKNEE